MHREITLDARSVAYTLRMSTRSRRMRLAIYGDGSLIVTAPRRMPEWHIEQFMRLKANWIIQTLDQIRSFPPQPKIQSSAQEYATHKDTALSFAQQRIAHFNTFYNFSYHKITIRNQKTRWGSCSKKRNLNFNYKIVLLPEALADYILVHELCHLAAFDHSPIFWALVERAIPDHRTIRTVLRKYPL